MKPIHRSKVRIRLGSVYYRVRRYLEWYFGKAKYAEHRVSYKLPVSVFQHKTPLFRKLQNVDMWMQHNKVINLKLALQQLDGFMIRPGETFSYWKTIGKPTRRKGYVDGMVLFYGQFKSGVGGGLCQLSNLIYWMTLHTPLVVTERHRHSYDVFPDSKRTQPFGSGATCAYNYIDLVIYNPTEEDYQLNLSLIDEYLTGSWNTRIKHPYTYEVYEKEHSISHTHWGGYIRKNAIYRRVLNEAGTCVDDQYITENEAIMMYEPLLQSID